jgi:hypothetical protein
VEPSDQRLAEWRDQYPDHPDLLELEIRRKLARGVEDEALRPLLLEYASLRPVDPFPHRQLARIELGSVDTTRAIPHLEALAIREEKSPVFAIELAKQYRKKGDLDHALQFATMALHINPYNASNRELANWGVRLLRRTACNSNRGWYFSSQLCSWRGVRLSGSRRWIRPRNQS